MTDEELGIEPLAYDPDFNVNPAEIGPGTRPHASSQSQIQRMTLEELDEEMRRVSDSKIQLSVKVQENECMGNLPLAKKAHERLKELTLLESMYLERKVEIYHEIERDRLEKGLSDTRSKFDAHWLARQDKFDSEWSTTQEAIESRHRKELEDFQKHAQEQVLTRKVRYSRRIQELKKAIALLVDRKQYDEAEVVAKQVEPLELEEIRRHQLRLQQTVARKKKQLLSRHGSEKAAIQQRVEQARKLFQTQYDHDLRQLVTREKNRRNAMVLSQRRAFAQYKSALQTQIEVVRQHYDKNMVDYQAKLRELGVDIERPSSYVSEVSPIRLRRNRVSKFGTGMRRGGKARRRIQRERRAQSASPRVARNSRKTSKSGHEYNYTRSSGPYTPGPRTRRTSFNRASKFSRSAGVASRRSRNRRVVRRKKKKNPGTPGNSPARLSRRGWSFFGQ